ncbi:MAG: HAD-IB family phosphatase [Deltaproteobacteria bacterium]|nr:HAD-IB family phosphatase [Deltaproteobacteria bacterium]
MGEKTKILTLSAIGIDSPGLVSKISTEIFRLKGNIIDVEENCRRGLFSIFLMIDFSASEHTLDEIAGTLKAIESNTGLKIIVKKPDRDDMTDVPISENYVVIILGIDQPGIMAKVSTFFHQYNINIENCKMVARGKVFSMEMVIDTGRMTTDPSMPREETIEKMKAELRDLCIGLNQSVVVQNEKTYKRLKKIIVFDVESSLIQDASTMEFLEGIADKLKSRDREIPLKKDRGDPMQLLIENAESLQGFPMEDLKALSRSLKLHRGTLDLIRILKSMGFKIALLSSGFDFFIKRMFEKAEVDYAFSNSLKVDKDGNLTGELEEPVLTSATKNEILELIMNMENITRDQVIAVGDGSTQYPFMKNVGLSIAYQPEDTDIKTDGILRSDHIINILYCLGIPESELDRYFEKTP